VRVLLDLFARSGLRDASDEAFDFGDIRLDAEQRRLFAEAGDDLGGPAPAAVLSAIGTRGGTSLFVRFLQAHDITLSRDALLAGIAATIAWGPLMRKRISRLTAETLPWYLRLFGVMIGASIPAALHRRDGLCGVGLDQQLARWSTAEFLFLALTGHRPTAAQARILQILVGLLISNGPGAISAQGAKGAVAADGPQTPQRVQINKAMIGALSHSGFSHGGNGYEGMAFLIEQFAACDLADPCDPDHGIDLAAMAMRYARQFKDRKLQARQFGESEPRLLPGVHHPIFRGKPTNFDPRERFVADHLEQHGNYNIFHAYYGELVRAPHEVGATPYVFCVNVDAMIAALLLAALWKPLRARTLGHEDLETAAFNVFLYGRMIGAAAEIDDHLNRGRNMDTRTPLEQCAFVV
jgi:hypothetical protein